MMSEQADVDEDLALDLVAYGNCFWKVVDGHKVRIPLDQIKINLSDGSLCIPAIAATAPRN